MRTYRELARALPRTRRGGLVLFETVGGDRPRVVAVRPAGLIASDLRPVPRSFPPPRTARCRVGPDRGFDLVARRSTLPSVGVTIVRELGTRPERGEGSAVGIQTFWFSRGDHGPIWVARRLCVTSNSTTEPGTTGGRWCRAFEDEWAARTGRSVELEPARPGWRRDWSVGGVRAVPRSAWVELPPELAVLTAEPWLTSGTAGVGDGERHTAVFGATGAGKTTFLADTAARAVRRGDAVVALDLHGDLAPAIVTRLPPELRRAVVAVDVSQRPTVGVAALAGADERGAGHFVGAVKRLTPDGQDVYWGFRLERAFDAFVRLVQETGGSVLDLYDLLTDADRRDVARLATRRPELRRFLDELGPIVRKTPDFLWPAAARLAKIALHPALAELLAPRDGGLDVEGLVASGRPLLVRLPFADVGPEAAAFAGTLVLARVYLGIASRRTLLGTGRRLLAVLDEVHGFSPRLVTELLTDGRKFGVALLLATQYPDRLAPELKSAVAGTVRDVIVFRVPAASAPEVGRWLGVSPIVAERVLPALSTGSGVVRRSGYPELVALPIGDEAASSVDLWKAAVRAASEEFGERTGETESSADDGVDTAALLAVLGAEEEGSALAAGGLPEAMARLSGEERDPAVVLDRLRELERRRFVETVDGSLRLTPAGARKLGLRTDTGATRESPEHRSLLLLTFRLFARRGCCLEIVRQGRYDTTLPDGIVRQLPRHRGIPAPWEVARNVDRARGSWAWRFFAGQDVFVEVEVSGALRPERIRRGVAKARRHGAFPLFVVGDARKAARVRKVLRDLGLDVRRAQVWTVRDGSRIRAGSPTAPTASPPPWGTTASPSHRA